MSRKYWRDVKVVTTNRAHECGVCSEQIPKGAKTLNESGRSETEGYFNSYFHLERSKGCYLDFMECVWSDGEEAKLILSSVIEDKPLTTDSFESTLIKNYVPSITHEGRNV